MTLPQAIYQAVVADADVKALIGDPPRFWGRGQLGRDGVPASPPLPYAMYGEGESTPAHVVNKTSPNTAGVPFTVYVYDDNRSFERIKDIHREIRRVLLALSGTTTSDGMMVTEVRWDGSGADNFDTVSKNNVKTSTFYVVGKV